MKQPENVIQAFTVEQVVKLTGLSKSKIYQWDNIGFFHPHIAQKNRRVAYSRVYSFKDVVSLRTLKLLYKDHQIPLKELKKVSEKLNHLADDRWIKFKFYVFNKKIHFKEPETQKQRSVVDGQFINGCIELKSISEDIHAKVRKMHKRETAAVGKVEIIGSGRNAKSYISGTRIPVSAILSFHEAGYSMAQIIREYPDIKENDIKAAINLTLKSSVA